MMNEFVSVCTVWDKIIHGQKSETIYAFFFFFYIYSEKLQINGDINI